MSQTDANGPRSPRLTMEGISKRFGATAALEGVSLRVFPGEVLALVGENGAGKSTLMKVLAGAHQPDAGAMRLDDQPFCPPHPLAARQAGVAMIYQELSLAPHLTVEENILLGVEPCRHGFIRWPEVRRRALEALRLFGHTDIRPGQPVRQLPVAAQQVVEIARALATGCRVLVLDEPTSCLSARDAERLFAMIQRLKGQGLSIIYISHFLEEVKRVADRVTVLRDGRTVAEGDLRELSADRIVTLMVGREVRTLYPRSPRSPGETILEISGLCGAEKPVDATLELRQGEVLGIAGLMGAGRTELLRCLFGLEPVRAGRLRLGAWVGPASPARRWWQGMGLLSEDRRQEGLALPLSIAENITMTSLRGFGPCGLVLPERQDRAARRWIERLGIRCEGPRQKVGNLSGGNQQKVALARLLQHEVDVLLLDEPTRGIDVAAKAAIYRIIDELATGADGGGRRAVLMVSSHLPELLGICDRLAVMSRGRLGPARPREQVDERRLMLEAAGQ